MEVSGPGPVREVACLAREIWNEHYPPIIGQAQVDYMLQKFQSEAAITAEMASGARYFLMLYQGGPAGYFAFRPELEERRMFLSKLYVRRKLRRRGLARHALKFVEEECRRLGLNRIYLSVNKYNEPAIAAYQRLGFDKAGARVVDIGGGFVMDDWIMEKRLDNEDRPGGQS